MHVGELLVPAVEANCDSVDEIQILVIDSGSGTVFGPFISGDVIKYTQDADAVPESKKISSTNGRAGAAAAHIIGNGDGEIIGVDSSGNRSGSSPCILVPEPPK